MNPNEFLTETTFQLKIEELVRTGGLTYLEAVTAFMEENDIEPEKIKKLLTVNLKDKIKVSAIESGYFKKEMVLPL